MIYYDDLKAEFAVPSQGSPGFRTSRGGITPEGGSTQDQGVFSQIGRGVGFGAIEAVRSVSQLGHYVTGFQALDWRNPINAPETTLGGLVGGATQFFVPYLGLSGALSKGASLFTGATGAVTGTGRALGWLAGVSAPKAVLAAQAAGGSIRGVALASMIARGTIKGGIVDFLAFGGDGGRLSDLIQANPNLANPVTALLASNEDDGEIEGRFKNLIEGGILGVAADSVIAAFRFRRAKAKAIAGGASDEAADNIASLKVEDSRQADILARKEQALAEDATRRAKVYRVAEEKGEGGKQYRVLGEGEEGGREITGVELEAESDKIVGRILKEFVEEEPDILSGKALSKKLEKIKSKTLPDGTKGFTEDQLADTVDQLRAGKDLGEQRVNPRTIDLEELVAKQLKRSDQNRSQWLKGLEKHQGIPEFGTLLMRAMERADLDLKKINLDHQQILAKTITEARKFGFGGTQQEFLDLLASLGKDPEDILRIALRTKVATTLAELNARNLYPELAKAVADPDLTFEAAQVLVKKADYHHQLATGARKNASAFGHALNSLKIQVDPNKLFEGAKNPLGYDVKAISYLSSLTQETFDKERVREMLDLLRLVTGGPDAMANATVISEFLDAPAWRKGTLALRSAHVNGLLSGVATHVTNVGSAAFLTFVRPMNQLMGGLLGKDRRVINQALATVTNLHTDFLTNYRAIKQSGHNPFAGKSRVFNAEVSPIRLLGQTDKGQKLASALGGTNIFTPMARLIETPSRWLSKEDLFMKMWSGRTTARASMVARFVGDGMPYDQAFGRAEELLEGLMTTQGKLGDQLTLLREIEALGGEAPAGLEALGGISRHEGDILLEALDRGTREAGANTFTGQLAKGSVFTTSAQALSSFGQHHPAFGFFVPFINTVAGIAQYGWDHTIGAVMGGGVETMRALGNKFGLGSMPHVEDSFLKLSRDLASPDRILAAEARARIAYGYGAVGSIIILASTNGDEDNLPILTGSGPTDPDVRKTFEAAGWAPYSMRIGGVYVSYARFDPFATMMGIIVDAAALIQEGTDADKQVSSGAILNAVVGSVAKNLTSKTYAQGLSNMLDAVTDPDRNLDRFAKSVAGSFVPTILSQVERAVDPAQQETRTVLDKMMSRIPGLSSRLPVSRDILGQPIVRDVGAWEPFLPLRITKVKDETVAKELSRFAYGFSTPSNKIGGLDLLDEAHDINGKAAYDEYTKAVGQVRIGGLDLRQALRKTFASEFYQSLDPETGPNGERSPRIEAIQKVLRQFRKTAFDELVRSRPDLQQAIRDADAIRAQRKQGRASLFQL